ncbi:anti-sigma factor family protein [Marinicaulis aureus]|uniref:Anti-sigma factor family protein n=1 Tax=Hyphococcus aureus TaxID=2666033 RepID=A0ABW1KYF2_9PROT
MKKSKPFIIDPTFEELSCYIDGELPEEQLRAIDDWLVEHPKALERLLKLRQIEGELRNAVKNKKSAPPDN